MPSLFVIRGEDQGKRYNLDQVAMSIGRDVANPIRLNDTEVSRAHAEIRKDTTDDGFIIVDVGSSNGTYINSRRVSRHPLKTGDRIQCGRTLMIYTGSESEGEPFLGDVSITAHGTPTAESRIIKSMANEDGSRVFGDGSESPWLARARSNLQIMYRTALAVSHTLDIDQLLQRIMDMIFEWVEADRGCVLLVDNETNELSPRAHRNRTRSKPGDIQDPSKAGSEDASAQPFQTRLNISRTIIDYVMQNNEGVLTSDAREDQRFDAAGSIFKMGVTEAIAVPMQGRYGVVGLIYIDTYTPPGRLLRGQANKFHEEHLKLMIAIGHQAALAVEDTSYYSAMVQAERLAAIGQTIAGLSHHVKNILQGIRGGSYLIEEGLKGEQTPLVEKGWRIVERNQEKISRLVLDMLTFSKERTPEMIACNINQVVGEAVELMSSRATEQDVTIEWTPQTTIPETTLDPHGIQHAILNVLTNAIDACENTDGGRVRVHAQFNEAKRIVEVVVADNGEGIPSAELKKIFNLFESSKGNRGTGLGLSVSQKILKEHGGIIEVDSQPAIGSTFTLRLPWNPPTDPNPEETHDEEPPSSPLTDTDQAE